MTRNPQLLPPRSRPRGTYFRPKVLHNPRGAADARWVLWGNWVNMSTSGGPRGMVDYHSYYFSAIASKVRKTPSWPRSWANFSLF